jgi:hypothetical protein
MALSIAVVLVSAASAVDLGFWRFQQRLEQTAADAAALAAAIEYSYSASLTGATTVARAAATANGFTHDGVNVTVTVNYPPAAGGYLGNTNALEVLVKKEQPQFFAGVLGGKSRLVAARAVALLSSNSRNCIYALSPNSDSLLVNGSTVNIPQCGMTTDGSLTINGATVTAGSITYTAGDTVNGSTLPAAQPQKAIAATDPCMTLSGCRYLTQNPPSKGTCLNPNYTGSGITVQAGTYCSQLMVNGANGVTFAPGLYVLEQGMLINGSTSVTGTGVTFYNVTGTIVFNGSSPSFSAPATGSMMGVLMYQPASNTTAFVYNGSSGPGLAGALYFPSTSVTINGSLSSWLLVVGYTVTINGSGVNVGSNAFPGFTHVVLAE